VKNPLEPYDWSAWDGFARRLSEHGGARGINVVGSAAAGGVCRFDKGHWDEIAYEKSILQKWLKLVRIASVSSIALGNMHFVVHGGL
jgi:hypothetical protein